MASEQLKNFRSLNETLREATEEQCQKLLKEEKENGKRYAFLTRIYGRMNKLRAQRERLEIVQNAKQ